MTLHRLTMALAVSLAASLLHGAAGAQQGPPAPDKVDLPPSPWLQAVARTFPNQPVLAAGYAPDPEFTETLVFPPKGSLQERLEAMAWAAGKDRMAYEARKVGRLWALGPGLREEIRTEAGQWTLYDVGTRELFLNRLLSMLSEEQAKRLGTDEGLPVRDLSEDARRLLAAAFRPPVRLFSMARADPPGEKAKGKPSPEAVLIRGWGYVREEDAVLNEPIDWSRARLRGHLLIDSVMIDLPGGSPGKLINWGEPARREFVNTADMFVFVRNLNPPVTSYVLNTLKASDLTGSAARGSIGLSGITTVGKVIRRLADATGQDLRADPSYTNVPVYIGRPDIPAGDVLDGLRFALSAAVRKVGNTHTLTWDREGLAAVQQKVRESLWPLQQEANRMDAQARTGQGWLHLAYTLPFGKDEGFALTDAQRHTLLDPPQDPGQWQARIPWQDMTEQQQFAIRRLAVRANAGLPRYALLPGNSHTLSEADLKRAYLSEGVGLDLEVDVPGVGWVSVGRGAGVGWISRFSLDEARQEARRVAGSNTAAEEAAGPGRMARPVRQPDRPLALNSATRAIMVPILSPERLRETLTLMKDHGLNTLFYPAFTGGYTTFASEAFPRHPDLAEGANGADWSAAAHATGEAGIRLVAYIHTLAWQTAGDQGSWLTEHPEWVDVDVLGRPRAAWFREHAEQARLMDRPTVPPANYVRPSVPEVQAKLKALVAEMARLPATTGIAFTDFDPNLYPYRGFGEHVPPPLGYRPPDRESVLKQTGADPIDIDSGFIPLALQPVNQADLRYRPFQWGDPPPDPRLLLLEQLVKTADAARDDWTVLALNEAEPGPGPTQKLLSTLPELDGAVATVGPPMGHEKLGMYLPVRPRPARGTANAFREDPVQWAVGFAGYSRYGTTLRLMLFDFRTAPELIPETLSQLGPPGEDPMRTRPILRPAGASAAPARQ